MIMDGNKIEVEIEDQINNMLYTSGKEITKDILPPADQHVIMINKEKEKILRNKDVTFHSVTAK